MKVGIRREWGATIIFFGMTGGGPGTNNTNTIDSNDTGREVQIALYDSTRIVQGCAYNASCQTTGAVCFPLSITYLGWNPCLLYTSPSPRDKRQSRMPSSA